MRKTSCPHCGGELDLDKLGTIAKRARADDMIAKAVDTVMQKFDVPKDGDLRTRQQMSVARDVELSKLHRLELEHRMKLPGW